MIEVQMIRSNDKNLSISGVLIKIQEMTFNESCTFRIELFNGKTLGDIKFITVNGENYSRWYNDDDYIIDYILDQVGCIRKNGERKVYREPVSEEDYSELEDELNSYREAFN